MKQFYLRISLIITVICITLGAYAQKQTRLDQALRFIESQAPAWNLSPNDVSDLIVSDNYTDDHNGVTHFYFNQQYNGIPIHNAITSVHITKDGRVFNDTHRFVDNLDSKINTSKTKLTAQQALEQLIRHLGIPNAIIPPVASRSSKYDVLFEQSNFTSSPIPAKLKYQLMDDGSLRLVWNITTELSTNSDHWNTNIDAISGQVIGKQNFTVYCTFDHDKDGCNTVHTHKHTEFIPVQDALVAQNTTTNSARNAYRVIKVPAESPNHGPHVVVENPAHPTASPFGWHDTSGVAGAEWFITRGNNAHAYLDNVNRNGSSGDEPNGGTDLVFDFPLDKNAEPADYRPAAVTNLFYMCNTVHDVLYQYGFTEAAGNFQVNNYGKGGLGRDHVRAEAQDGSGTNNANFSTPADGGLPRMQMYVWTRTGDEVYVTAPAEIEGYIKVTRGNFGATPTTTPIEGDAAVISDGSRDSSLACRNTVKRMDGKVALIDRGVCEFGTKCLRAQNAGAIAVVICNFEDAALGMAAGADGGKVTIPCYMAKKSTCDKLKLRIKNGENVRIKVQQLTGTGAGPAAIDGDFDNGIIAHEFGHGVSNRLTGGPSTASCLGNADQMGEGWSDFMTLIFAQQSTDTRNTVKGIGTYAANQPTTDIGIRRRPYSTNMAINEFTLKNMGSETHDVGEVWTVMLWDLYWNMADKYGYDPDFSNKNSGNAKAIQLVMDGMKLQVCQPGFVDGRNAILKADSINNAGANSCLIWETFARRGLGYFANQGNRNLASDETESYESHPLCQNILKVTKTAPDVVGVNAEFTIKIRIDNYKPGTLTNIAIKDNIPVGTTYVNNSANPSATISGNTISWNVASLASLKNTEVSYKVKVDAGISSRTLFYDDLENGEFNWEIDSLSDRGSWFLNPFGVNGSNAWHASESELPSNFSIYQLTPVKLDAELPVLTFMHRLNTQQGGDIGLFEFATDGINFRPGSSDLFITNGYNTEVPYGLFVIPNLRGWSGTTNAQYVSVIADLSAYKGQHAFAKFRYGTDSSVVNQGNPVNGWLIDNIEYLDAKFLNSEVCATSAQGDNECVSLKGRGALVESNHIVKNKDIIKNHNFVVFPNPAKDVINILANESNLIESAELRTINGALIARKDNLQAQQTSFSTSDIPSGMYLVTVKTAVGFSTRKVAVK